MRLAFGEVTEWSAKIGPMLLVLVVAKRPPVDPVADLTDRLRHPVRYRVQHPVRSVRRLWRR
jgi:hypothetical protein